MHLQDIEGCHRKAVHARDVAEGLGQPSLLPNHDQWSLAADIASVPHLSLASTDVSALLCLLNILISSHLNSGGQKSIQTLLCQDRWKIG